MSQSKPKRKIQDIALDAIDLLKKIRTNVFYPILKTLIWSRLGFFSCACATIAGVAVGTGIGVPAGIFGTPVAGLGAGVTAGIVAGTVTYVTVQIGTRVVCWIFSKAKKAFMKKNSGDSGDSDDSDAPLSPDLETQIKEQNNPKALEEMIGCMYKGADLTVELGDRLSEILGGSPRSPRANGTTATKSTIKQKVSSCWPPFGQKQESESCSLDSEIPFSSTQLFKNPRIV